MLSSTWQCLVALNTDLEEVRGELAEVAKAERSDWLNHYATSTATTDSGRKRDADLNTLPYWKDRTELEMKIKVKEELRQLLILAIEHGVEII